MNTTTSSTSDTSTDGFAKADDESTPDERVFEKGSWQEALATSTTLLDRSTKARKRASSLLWDGAQTAINEWLPGSKKDVSGENFYAEVLDILGKPRKGDASKIRTVALAVKDHGLVLTVHPNLSKAYAEAVRLTKTQAAQQVEDDAAEKAIESLTVPKTTGSVEGAAALLLSKGIDGAVVAILDALGANNEAAHRSFARAVSTEIASRVQAAKPKPAPKAPAKPKGAAKVAQVKTAGTKAKPAKGSKAKPVAVSKSKGDPNKRALPVKTAAASKGEPVSAPVSAGDGSTKAKPVVVRR